MSINKEAYLICLSFLGQKEIDGLKNNPIIEVAHALTKISSETPKGDVDSSIPWCSSWVVFCIMLANIRRNPGASYLALKNRNHSNAFIKKVFDFAGVDFSLQNKNTGLSFVPPTWSANSKSWDTWGYAVSPSEAKRGDLVRFTREGGGHIAFLDEDSMGRLFVKVVGGNQNNMVCSSNSYSRLRVVHVRRAYL